MQDRGLVEQAQRGDAEAFDSLARMVGDRCLAIAVRILRDIDLAEDAVQGAFITAWTELRSPARPVPLRAVAPPHPHQRVLRRGQASQAVVRGTEDPPRRGRVRPRRLHDRR